MIANHPKSLYNNLKKLLHQFKRQMKLFINTAKKKIVQYNIKPSNKKYELILGCQNTKRSNKNTYLTLIRSYNQTISSIVHQIIIRTSHQQSQKVLHHKVKWYKTVNKSLNSLKWSSHKNLTQYQTFSGCQVSLLNQFQMSKLKFQYLYLNQLSHNHQHNKRKN